MKKSILIPIAVGALLAASTAFATGNSDKHQDKHDSRCKSQCKVECKSVSEDKCNDKPVKMCKEVGNENKEWETVEVTQDEANWRMKDGYKKGECPAPAPTPPVVTEPTPASSVVTPVPVSLPTVGAHGE